MDAHSTDVRSPSPPLTRYAWLVWIMWVVWVLFLVNPIKDLATVQRPPIHFWLALVTLIVFVAIYLGAAWYIARYLAMTSSSVSLNPRWAWGIIVTMTLLSFFVSLYNGAPWQEFFIFTIAIVSGLLHDIRVVLVALVFVLLLVVCALLSDPSHTVTTATILLVMAVSATATSVIRFVIVNRQLRQTREEMVTRLAVSDERLRIARDLHDLLGHNLSLIALKSELARRLLEEAPQRAADEIRDIEAVAREALREVRETISGYRQPTLASELYGAQEMLTAAAITCSCEATVPVVPVAIEVVLAWAVREGATNVIRHSRAKRCTIQVTHDGQQVSVLVTDDGVGGSGQVVSLPDASPCYRNVSSGLIGLSERVAGCGGTLEAGSLPEGGFRLSVSLPLKSAAALPAKANNRLEKRQGEMATEEHNVMVIQQGKSS